jgi:hypothetical protein
VVGRAAKVEKLWRPSCFLGQPSVFGCALSRQISPRNLAELDKPKDVAVSDPKKMKTSSNPYGQKSPARQAIT